MTYTYGNDDDDDNGMLGNYDANSKQEQIYDGRRQRKPITRRWIDHQQAFTLYRQDRPFESYDQYPQNIPDQLRNLYPPFAYRSLATSITSKIIRASTNKNKSSILSMAWQPDGKRLVAGYQSGLVTLWNGMGFQFEILMQRHDVGATIMDLIWSHSGDYMLTVDQKNLLKVWQTNYDVIQQWTLHSDKVRQLSFAPGDRKFASCSDDTTVKIWDLATSQEETTFNDHGCNVRTLDWHPSRSLIVSGGKDGAIHFLDPRVGSTTPNLATISLHKGLVTKIVWNKNGNWVLSSGKDSKIRLVDVRNMSEWMTFQGHERDVFTVEWHPIHEDLFVSGSFTGELFWWCVGYERPIYALPKAHLRSINQLKFHPFGHILASSGQEGVVKFWVRNRAGDDVTKSSNEVHVEEAAVSNNIESNDIPGLTQYDLLFGK